MVSSKEMTNEFQGIRKLQLFENFSQFVRFRLSFRCVKLGSTRVVKALFFRAMDTLEVKFTTECSQYHKDPIKMKQLVDKIVDITTVDNKKVVGRVYTIDPVSNSIVLFNVEGTVEVVVGHAVKHIEPSSVDVNIPQLNIFSPKKVGGDVKDYEVIRLRLKTWLLENRIPIEEDGNVLIVNKALSIYPPYGSDQCICSNTVMLEKVQRLISLMPNDKS